MCLSRWNFPFSNLKTLSIAQSCTWLNKVEMFFDLSKIAQIFVGVKRLSSITKEIAAIRKILNGIYIYIIKKVGVY